jgi:hypothetical protein
MKILRVFLCCALVFALGCRNGGRAAEQFYREERSVLLNGVRCSVVTLRLTTKQLEVMLRQKDEDGWRRRRADLSEEIITYQLAKENRKMRITYFPRQQTAIVIKENGKRISQRELMSMLAHPPGKLKLSFASESKDMFCLLACFDATAGQLSHYRSRLQRAGWQKWFTNQVELWERKGSRLGINQGDKYAIVWLLTKGGRNFD